MPQLDFAEILKMRDAVEKAYWADKIEKRGGYDKMFGEMKQCNAFYQHLARKAK
jgi:hypothetical protein